jgi:hypothetical protein
MADKTYLSWFKAHGPHPPNCRKFPLLEIFRFSSSCGQNTLSALSPRLLRPSLTTLTPLFRPPLLHHRRPRRRQRRTFQSILACSCLMASRFSTTKEEWGSSVSSLLGSRACMISTPSPPSILSPKARYTLVMLERCSRSI